MWEEGHDAGGMDELLAAMGYKVRSSEMADVAQKREQLEMAPDTTWEDRISHNTVHYDLMVFYGWLQSMLFELRNSPNSLEGNGGRGLCVYSDSRTKGKACQVQ